MDTNPAAAGFSASKLQRISAHLQENYIQPGKIAGCQVMVSRHGTPAYFQSLGEMDRERGKPVADDTIFRIYSMTKPITSIALMMLFEEGRFQLNDPVYRFLPAWRGQQVWVQGTGEDMETRPPASPMTMRHILSHTAGLTYGALLPIDPHPVDAVYQQLGVNRGDGETIQTFADKMAQVPLRYDPGTKWLYSLATDVCGCLVEAISGQKFEDFLQQRIFETMGMQDTAFWVPEKKVERFAANYERARDKSLRLIDDPQASKYLQPPSFPSGGGGLVSTTADYAKFCEMLRLRGTVNGVEIIGSRTLALMTKNHIAGGADLSQAAMGAFSETAYEGVGFGLGFASTLGEVASGTVGAGDYYWGGAASTIFWVDPVEDLYVVFMTQLMPSATFNFRGQLKNIIYGAIND
ncbi:MAG: serine hydrolase domain-containing protein [Pseudomonadota bacterium]|nr:serine hydrolase domain-containing protein [Pseudomonadota bacterium]